MRTKAKRIDDSLLVQLWPTGISDEDLAYRLGHHRGVIRRRAARLGLPLRWVARQNLINETFGKPDVTK